MNAGFNFSTKGDTTHFFSGALGLGIPLTDAFSVMGEVSTEQGSATIATELRQSLIKINMGCIEKLSARWSAFASVGQSLYTSDVDAHHYLLFGFRFNTLNAQE